MQEDYKFRSMVALAAPPHNEVMKGLDKRIAARRKELRLTMEALAERIGVAWQAVQSWENGTVPRTSKHESIAAALETTVEELFYGQPQVKSAKGGGGLSLSSVKPTHGMPIVELKGRVPLINWSQAGQWKETPFHPADAEGWLQVTARVGTHAFALRVIGDSMEPRMPEGAYAVIDPDRPPEHKSIVLTKRPGEAPALRMLWLDGDTPYLKALNSAYPLAAYVADTVLIGVAVQVVLDL